MSHVRYPVLFFLLSLLFLDARSVVLIVLGTACVASLIYGIIMHFLCMNISMYASPPKPSFRVCLFVGWTR
jgi:hypothetical protein